MTLRRLDVAVNDPLLMGVLDRLADRHEQLQPFARRPVVVVAVLGDGHAVDQFHDEVRPAVLGGAAIEDAGDVDMVHEGQRLALGLEAGDDLAAVHTRLDDLEGDLAPDRVSLLGHEDHTHAALADLLKEPVRTYGRSRPVRRGLVNGRQAVTSCGTVQETVWRVGGPQQGLDMSDPSFVRATGLPDVLPPAVRIGDISGGVENRLIIGQ